jgi:hypothetical protein
MHGSATGATFRVRFPDPLAGPPANGDVTQIRAVCPEMKEREQ